MQVIRMGRVLVALGALIVLAGCAAAQEMPRTAPQPFVSPLYLPVVLHSETAVTQRPHSPKQGVTLACGSSNLAAEVARLRATWVWNWGTHPGLYPNVESIPAIWDASRIGKPLGGNSAWLLGFNEPDIGNQANMTPAAAAVAWRQIEAAYPDRKLASPQVIYGPSGWLTEFRNSYIALYGRPPRLNALAIHTYVGNAAADYIAQVQSYIELAKQWDIGEVWVTEFALAPAMDRTLRETMTELEMYLAWLDAEPMVTRYAVWTNRVECMNQQFGFRYDGPFDTPLIHLDGSMSELGKVFAGRAW
jgi:hypothetical protein